jgi:hypothetical protein
MTPHIPESFFGWLFAFPIVDNATPPRDPNDDDDEDEEEDEDEDEDEDDDKTKEPPVVREPDQDEAAN